jgi:hypothetical protein
LRKGLSPLTIERPVVLVTYWRAEKQNIELSEFKVSDSGKHYAGCVHFTMDELEGSVVCRGGGSLKLSRYISVLNVSSSVLMID